MNLSLQRTAMTFKKVKGLEAKIFALLLLFLPVNLAKHFIFDFCYVDGILVDYLIPTIYLTDILIGVLLFLWLFRFLRCGQYSSIYRCTIRGGGSLVVFGLGIIAVSGLSILGALNQPTAVYRWLKLVEYVLFSFYISKHIDLKKDFSTIVKLLSVGVLFESVLAIAQWFKQGSIFGFWFLGENKYTVSTSGIAILDSVGIRKARPYGTFPHPNVLGGYLAIVLPWITYAGVKGIKGVKEMKDKGFYFRSIPPTSVGGEERKEDSKGGYSFGRYWGFKAPSSETPFHFLVLGLGLVALFLSFSRSAWVVGFLGLLGVLVLNFKRCFSLPRFSFPSSPPASRCEARRAGIFPARLAFGDSMAGGHLPSSVLYSLSFLRRAELNWIALEMIKDKPFLGVGLNNFTVAMGKYGEVSGWISFLQPVHNVYLLIAAETGLLGLAVFLCLLLSIFYLLKKKNYLLLISMTQIILLCFVDHYFFTLQQTSLLFWLLVGLVFIAGSEV